MVSRLSGSGQATNGAAHDADAVDDVLGVYAGAFETTDPVALGRSFVGAMTHAARHPVKATPAWLRFGLGMGVVGVDTAARARRRAPAGGVEGRVEGRPVRITGMERQLRVPRAARDLPHGRTAARRARAHGARGRATRHRKAEFAAQLLTDALAPTNFLLTNPAAIERCFETAGLSTVRGFRNFLHDLLHNDGWPRQVDRSQFVVGANTAATPGQRRVPQRPRSS